LWDWVAKGTFPPPCRLSTGVTAWKRCDLKAWADGSWVAAPNQPPDHLEAHNPPPDHRDAPDRRAK
jgi:hypothetical protein